jgi:hypothetical protein
MPRPLYLVLFGILLILLRTQRRNPAFVLLGVVLFNRKTRRAAARLLFELGRNPRLRRMILRLLFRR